LTAAEPAATHAAAAAGRTLRPVPRIRAWDVLLLGAFLVGAALRAWQIDIQILIDDEWHAVHKLLRSGPVDILTHLGYADYSIPLTLYFQALYRTIGLSEWGMHLPSLLAGIGLLLVGPRLLARSFARPTQAIWTTLVAVSPLLVYHSKIARPYALTSLLTFVAFIAFRAWWIDRRSRDALLYAAATCLAGWLHAITLPFTLLPFVYCAVRSLFPVDAARLLRLVRLGLATSLTLAVVLGPPLVNDWTEFALKAGRDAVTPQSLYRTALMLAGVGSAPAAALLWAAAALGFWRLLRRESDLAWYLATIVGVGTAVVASARAEWISHPLVLARYLIPALPMFLLLAAEGVAGVVDDLRPRAARPLVVGIGAAALLFAGPIPGEWHYPNQFWGHLRYQFDYAAQHNPYVQLVPDEPVPAFYTELGRRPAGSVTLIEAPWRPESHYNALSLYQDVHHQLIRIGLVTPACGTYDFGEYPEERHGMRMREMVHLSAVLRGEWQGADYLVVHPKPDHVATDPGAAWPDVSRCLPAIEAALGAPIYRDGAIVVFALPHVSPLGNTRRTVQQ
jgi:hypothetical protein